MANAVAAPVEAVHGEDELRILVGDRFERGELPLHRFLRSEQVAYLNVHAPAAPVRNEVDLGVTDRGLEMLPFTDSLGE